MHIHIGQYPYDLYISDKTHLKFGPEFVASLKNVCIRNYIYIHIYIYVYIYMLAKTHLTYIYCI